MFSEIVYSTIMNPFSNGYNQINMEIFEMNKWKHNLFPSASFGYKKKEKKRYHYPFWNCSGGEVGKYMEIFIFVTTQFWISQNKSIKLSTYFMTTVVTVQFFFKGRLPDPQLMLKPCFINSYQYQYICKR